MQPDPHEIERILPVKQALEPKLITVPGVTGIDVGLKEVGGERTPEHAILVFVRQKGEYEPEHEIPRAIEGVPTDVIEATFDLFGGPVAEEDTVDATRYDPEQGGSCISPARIPDRFGTLGVVVKDATSGAQLWLSNYHVMCVDQSWPTVDKRIVQPSMSRGANPATDTIGSVLRGTFGQVVVPWGYDLWVDAAVCDVGGRAISTSILQLGTPAGARSPIVSELVKKRGAVSQYGTGQIASTNFTFKMTPDWWWYYQYRVEPVSPGGPPLAVHGDSGSAVLDSGNYLVGLVMAGESTYTVVNPIGQIFAALNLTI